MSAPEGDADMGPARTNPSPTGVGKEADGSIGVAGMGESKPDAVDAGLAVKLGVVGEDGWEETSKGRTTISGTGTGAAPLWNIETNLFPQPMLDVSVR